MRTSILCGAMMCMSMSMMSHHTRCLVCVANGRCLSGRKRLNLTGKVDLVEFHDGIPYPVEYKSGRHKEFENDYAQLCAQAICLEEMFGVPVVRGAIFWHGSRE